MSTLTIILAGLPLVFILPGTLVAWDMEPSWSLSMRLAVGFVLSCLLVSMGSFAVACVFGTSIHYWIPALVAAAVSSLAGMRLWIRRRAPT